MNSNCIPISFTDFPEDVQLCILSFLSLPEIAIFACTSKRSLSLYNGESKLWQAMCDRRWGTKTQIKKWGNGRIPYKLLYKTLNEWDNLIGFWRRSGQTRPSAAFGGPPLPPLVLFEWGSSFLTGSRISPSQNGTYCVVKSPFLWMSLSSSGETLNFVDSDGKRSEPLFGEIDDSNHENDGDLIPVDVNFVGVSHMVVEEKIWIGGNSRKKGLQRSPRSPNSGGDEEDVNGADNMSPGSLPEEHMSEMYQYFANRTSPGGNGLSRRQRKREKERQGKMKWGAEHFVKIAHCSPTPSRPLQGLWKGIGDDMKLEFYLVTYDEIGGIACRRVGDSGERISGCPFVFWTSKASILHSPFAPAELTLYESRVHLHPLGAGTQFYCQVPSVENEVLSYILYINTSDSLLIPDMVDISIDPHRVEGRIWQYENGTFGFGFLRDNFIIDLKHIAQNGCLLDSATQSRD